MGKPRKYDGVIVGMRQDQEIWIADISGQFSGTKCWFYDPLEKRPVDAPVYAWALVEITSKSGDFIKQRVLPMTVDIDGELYLCHEDPFFISVSHIASFEAIETEFKDKIDEIKRGGMDDG